MRTINWVLVFQTVWCGCCVVGKTTPSSGAEVWSSWEKGRPSTCSVTCGAGSREVTYVRHCGGGQRTSQKCVGDSKKTKTVWCTSWVNCVAKATVKNQSSAVNTVIGVMITAFGLVTLLIGVIKMRSRHLEKERLEHTRLNNQSCDATHETGEQKVDQTGIRKMLDKKKEINEYAVYDNFSFVPDEQSDRTPTVTTNPIVTVVDEDGTVHKKYIKY